MKKKVNPLIAMMEMSKKDMKKDKGKKEMPMEKAEGKKVVEKATKKAIPWSSQNKPMSKGKKGC